MSPTGRGGRTTAHSCAAVRISAYCGRSVTIPSGEGWAGIMAKISVLISDSEEVRFGEYCDMKGYKKSTLIARLIRDHLDREGFRVQDRLFVEDPVNRPSFGNPLLKK